MATTSTSTAVAAVEPVFTEPERLALAGFLAGYTGLTREAYALDLRQYASWCQQNPPAPVPGPPRRRRVLRP
jgi:integrase/recombinase XerD